VLLVAEDGTEYPIHVANRLPWDAAAAVGRELKVSASRVELRRVRVVADAPAAPEERRRRYQSRFDFEGYYGAE
jgi:hypothetical protein